MQRGGRTQGPCLGLEKVWVGQSKIKDKDGCVLASESDQSEVLKRETPVMRIGPFH